MIDINESWNLVLSSAKKAKRLNVEFKSIRAHMPYKIGYVSETKIEIIVHRSEPRSFGPEALRNQLKKLNKKGGALFYYDFFGNVAKETAVVFLHPNLSWDADKCRIIDLNAR